MIVFSGISHSYPKSPRPVLEDVSFEIAAGDCVTLMGPSGCGKSTLAKIAAGHLRPNAGRVIANGIDKTGRPSRDIFLVHQESDLFPWQNARQHLDFVLNFGRSKLTRGELFKLVRLEGAESRYPIELSGGMKKRLALARALALNPKLIIIDEAFSALDPELRTQLIEDLRRIWTTLGTTILLISHSADEALAFGNKKIRLDGNGRLVS